MSDSREPGLLDQLGAIISEVESEMRQGQSDERKLRGKKNAQLRLAARREWRAYAACLNHLLGFRKELVRRFGPLSELRP